MALDLKAWLLEMGVPAHKADDMLPSLADATVAANIEKFGLRQADFSRQSDALTAKQRELDAASAKLAEGNERLNLEMVEWAEERSKGGVITDQMRTDMAAAQAEVTRLKSIVTSKATELGLDPKTIIGEPAAPAPTPQPQPAPNLAGYVRVEDQGQMGRYLMRLQSQISQIQHEHQQLTGEWLDPDLIMTEIETRGSDKLNRNTDGSLKRSIDPRAIWEEKFDVPAKRAAKATAAHDAEIAAAEARGAERALSQTALPGQQAPGRHAPVFTRPGAQDASKMPRPSQASQQDRISRAASALATHRYRQGGPGGAQPPAAGGRT